MPLNQIILFLETPRAGGEKGHRWLVPQSSRPITDAEIAETTARLEGAEPTGKILTARRKVGQVVQGNTRDAWEMLVVAGLPHMEPAEKDQVTNLLEQFLDTFDPNLVDWESGSELVIPTIELDALYSTLQSLSAVRDPKANAPEPRDEPPPRKEKKMKKFVIGILAVVFALLAVSALLPDGCNDSGGGIEDDPIWKSFLAFREQSFRPGSSKDRSAIEDAKYLWENVTASKWTGGDFLRTDLTRNSPDAISFLELETPETWYITVAFDRSDDAAELRAILPATGTPSDPKSTPFGREFVRAMADSSKQLIQADLSQLDPVAVEFIERQRAKLQEIPDNDRLNWPTPADGRRATVLFEAISELSRSGPVERRIRTWDDLLSKDIAHATVTAGEVDSDPVAAVQWKLMKPIVTSALTPR